MIKFGTDGWRGVMAADFTFANVALVAGAVADFVVAHNLAGRGVVIGYDNRFLSERFADTAAEVLGGRGIRVYLARRAVPTPVVAFAVRQYRAGGAVMLTASHNPPEYNGIKFIPEYAGPALPEITDEIEEYILRRQRGGVAQAGAGNGPSRQLIDPAGAYSEHLLGLVDTDSIRKAGLHVVVDPLHGAGIGYLDGLLGGLGVKVNTLHNHRDPLFGGSFPDPSAAKLGPLRDIVLREGAHLGLGLDGDADRLGVIDADGTFISPNQFLTLVYYHLVTHRRWQGPVARTVATTHLVDRIARDRGQEVIETPVGFKFIGQALLEQDCVVGGEESGGLSMRGHVPEKDGILAGMLAAEMVAAHGKPLKALLDEVGDTYGHLHSERLDVRTTADRKPLVLEKLRMLAPDQLAGQPVAGRFTVDGTKLVLEDGAWVLVRASGTEPVFRIYTEAYSREQVGRIQAAVRQLAGL
ncbi:MAG: phosphoglucomutase/phosphomannomutase family protein [Candidatus Desulforudis sp.]|nr:phosphoglucomutase/phosphomannomutase family protein [Desulforudis sp.]